MTWKILVDFHVLTVANACKLPIVSKSGSVSGRGGEGEGAHLLRERRRLDVGQPWTKLLAEDLNATRLVGTHSPTVVGDSLDEAWRWGGISWHPGILPHLLGYRIAIHVLIIHLPFVGRVRRPAREYDNAVPIARTEITEGDPIRLPPAVLRTNSPVPPRPNSNSVLVVTVYIAVALRGCRHYY